MKQVLKYILIGSLVFSTTGCKDFLEINPGEVKPLKESYYRTQSDFEGAIMGTYSIFTLGNLYGNRFNGRVGWEVDEGASAYNTDGNGTSIGLYENLHSGNGLLYSIYGDLFKGVRNASTIINLIDDSEMEPGVERDHIKGQAYFLRGLFYLHLVNLYGGITLVEYKEGIEKEIYSVPRSSEKEVLQYLIKDLEKAADLLKPIQEVGVGIQASKSAAWGILARANLKLAGDGINETSGYAEAAKYAKKVIDEGYHALNPSYKDIWVKLATDQFDAKEVLFEINFMGNNIGPIETKAGSMQGRSNGILNRTPTPSASGGFAGHSEGILVATPYLYRLYRDYGNTADTRYYHNIPTYWWRSSGSPAGAKITLGAAQLNNPYQAFYRFCGKFNREHEAVASKAWDNMYGPQNVSILRYSDVLLMYAEALIRSNPGDAGKYAEAMEYVNTVRRRSIPANAANRELPTTMPVAGGEAEELYGADNVVIKHIIEERARELCFEGLRKFDLNRWGIFYKRAVALKEEWKGAKGTITTTGIPANSITATGRYYEGIEPHKKIWPLDAGEISMNPNLVQNEGY